jgi:hypothetical protein
LDPAALCACTPQLVAALQTGNVQRQTLACHLLDMLPPHALAPHALALVRPLLSNTSGEVSVLTKLDLPADPEVHAALWEALESDKLKVRSNALKALEKQPAEALPVHLLALLRCLLTFCEAEADDDDYDDVFGLVLEGTNKLLQRVDKCELAKHTELLMSALGDTRTDEFARHMAMGVVWSLPPAALAPHAQLLLQLLRQPDEGQNCSAEVTRSLAADILLKLELPVLSAMMPQVLAAAAADEVCSGATLLLSKLPPATLAEHATTVLRALLHRSCEPGKDGIEVLRQVDPAALASHTSAMQDALRHNDVNVRRNALLLLGASPSHSIAVHTEALRSLLWDADPLVSKLAVEFLVQLPNQGLPDELSALLENPGYNGHRVGLLPVLSQLSGSARPPPAAVRLLDDPDPDVRASAIGTLAMLDPSVLQENTGLLLTALGDTDAEVRETAMEVFGQLPAAALAEHVPACLHVLKNLKWGVRTAARKALEKVDASVLAAHMELIMSLTLKGNESRRIAWDAIPLLPPASLAPHLACLLSFFCRVDSLDWRHMQKIVLQVVSCMPRNDVARILLDKDNTLKILALDRVFSHLPAGTLSLHAPLLMIMTRDKSPRVQVGAFGTLAKLEPAELAKNLPALLLQGLLDREPAVRCAAMSTFCRLPLDELAAHAAWVLRMLWDSDSHVREEAMQRAEEMRIQFGASQQLKKEFRRAAVKACNAAGGAVAAAT